MAAEGWRIESLYDHRALVPAVAGWIYDEWHHLMAHDSVAAWTAALENRLRPAGIHTTFVAFLADSPAGVASLVAQDLPIREALSPWLAEVLVLPEHRCRGIGSALVQRVVGEARTLGVSALYLYTFDRVDFYRRLGWTVRERAVYHGGEIVIMQREMGA